MVNFFHHILSINKFHYYLIKYIVIVLETIKHLNSIIYKLEHNNWDLIIIFLYISLK